MGDVNFDDYWQSTSGLFDSAEKTTAYLEASSFDIGTLIGWFVVCLIAVAIVLFLVFILPKWVGSVVKEGLNR